MARSSKPKAMRHLHAVEGRLDVVTETLLAGWARNATEVDLAADLEIFINGALIGSVRADIYRRDLVEAGKGTGRHGFEFRLFTTYLQFGANLVSVREARSGIELDGSPHTIVYDDFNGPVDLRSELKRLLDKATSFGHIEDEEAVIFALLEQIDIFALRSSQKRIADNELLQRWQAKLEGESIGDAMSGLIKLALHQYGNNPLVVPTSEDPVVSIIIPVHNNYWYTHQCIARIVEFLPAVTIELILVDDGSTDETLIASLLTSGVRVIRNAVDHGFIAAVEAGARQACGEFIFLLNNDTEVTPGWLDELVGTMRADERIGVAGSKLVFPNGLLQECGGVVWRSGDGWNYGRDQDPNAPQFRFMRDADYVSGAALLIRRAVWDHVGGLSSYLRPAYYEDTDLCFKVRAAGFRVVVQPSSVVIHHEGVSAGTDMNGSGMKRYQKVNKLRFEKKWRQVLAGHSLNGELHVDSEARRYVQKSVLVIDDSVPTPDKDAGSVAIFSHIRSLIRIGFKVAFIPSDNLARISPYTEALERIGVECYVAPYVASVEQALRTYQNQFNVIYAHRYSNARYLGLAKAYNAHARIIYNVADLHFLRKDREAEFLPDPIAVRLLVEKLRREELAGVASADCTIVHSSHEKEVLMQFLPKSIVQVVPWSVLPRPLTKSFLDRCGVAFVGSKHDPNIDGVVWFLESVLPLLRMDRDSLPVYLYGSHADDERVIDAVARSGSPHMIKRIGWIHDLQPALSSTRLTVAPLRFGAGLKGKILESFSMGLPCVMTEIAAEGADLPSALQHLVTSDAARFAELVESCHQSEPFNSEFALAGLEFVKNAYSEAQLDRLLGGIVGSVVSSSSDATRQHI